MATTVDEGWCTTDDGVRLWYAVEGDGQPLVLCHGGPGLGDNLGPLAALLVDHAQVVRWEQRGSGRSDRVGPYAVDRFANDLDQLRHHLGFDRWVIGGHSWGASLALQTALAFPETAAGLVYVSGVGAGQEWRAAYRAEARRRRTAAEHGRLVELKSRDRSEDEEIEYRALAWAPDFADRSQARALATEEARSSVSSAINFEANATINAEVAAWDEGELLAECRHLQVPALVLHGAEDPRPVRAVEPLADALPAAELVVLPGAGHLPWVEAPQGTEAAITGLLVRVDDRGTP